jgi:hypothetical protein
MSGGPQYCLVNVGGAARASELSHPLPPAAVGEQRESDDYCVNDPLTGRDVGERHVAHVPVLIWFAWSDLMRNAGIVDSHCRRKPQVFLAFRAVRNGEVWRVCEFASSSPPLYPQPFG